MFALILQTRSIGAVLMGLIGLGSMRWRALYSPVLKYRISGNNSAIKYGLNFGEKRMRETMGNSRFRFRAWDKSNKEMVYSDKEDSFYINTKGALFMYRRPISDAQEEEYHRDYNLMQFTGLKDRNGVEIYELMELDNKFRVVFDRGSYVLQCISSGDIFSFLDNVKVRANEREITRDYAPI